MPVDHDTIIDCFVMDRSFSDQSNQINEIFTDSDGTVASLNQKSLSYFNKVFVFNDDRDPSTRSVNWAPQFSPSIIIDDQIYTTFVSAINDQTEVVSDTIFKMVDHLLFNYNDTDTDEDRELFLTTDVDISEIYVPESLSLSTTLVDGTVYRVGAADEIVPVPAFVKFSLTLQTGLVTKTFVVTIYASNVHWISGYNISTIVKVIPPLPYSQLYSSSLVGSTDNIFSTAFLSANLSYNTSQSTIGTIQVSGITSYQAVLTDSADNMVTVPFNILYKGRSPTLTEIREAIKDALLSSGVGDLAGWEDRIPGVFILGRFYLIPFWDMTYAKPNQDIFPSIVDYSDIGISANKIMESAAFGDISEYISIIPVYYNKMTVASVPDLTGLVDIQKLSAVIPDYQSFSPQDENFAYMAEGTKSFAQQLNLILAIDTGIQPPTTVYAEFTENLLTFYSFVINKYELCVITKTCYTTIMESSS